MSTLQKVVVLLLVTNICLSQYNYLCDFDTKFTENTAGSWTQQPNCEVDSQDDTKPWGAVIWLGADASTLLWTDYKIESKFQLQTTTWPTENSNAGIIFRVNSVGNNWYNGGFYAVVADYGNNRIVNHYYNVERNNYSVGSYVSETIDIGTDYTLQVVVTGSSWDIYLNGVYIHNGAGTSFASGSVGLRVYGASARFKTLYITLPTQSPTKNPSKSPTENPTNYPSTSPTKNPSKSPTENPTNYPSTSPTNFPTISPITYALTLNPTHIPTEPPTFNPTVYPTQNPSTSPTDIASGNVLATNITAFQSKNGDGNGNNNKEFLYVLILSVIGILSVIACINIVFVAVYFNKKRKRLQMSRSITIGSETMEDTNIESIEGDHNDLQPHMLGSVEKECEIELGALDGDNEPEISDDSGEDLYSNMDTTNVEMITPNYKTTIKDESESDDSNELYVTANKATGDMNDGVTDAGIPDV